MTDPCELVYLWSANQPIDKNVSMSILKKSVTQQSKYKLQTTELTRLTMKLAQPRCQKKKYKLTSKQTKKSCMSLTFKKFVRLFSNFHTKAVALNLVDSRKYHQPLSK